MNVPSRTSRRRDLERVFREGVLWSLMVGMGETFFAAFVLSLGLGEVWAGWVATFPILVGGFIQLVTPYGVNLLRSRRRWVEICALVQALTFIPLIWGAVEGHLPGWTVFLVASLYWGSGLGAGPAWNAWMTRLIPAALRPRFFARRTAAANVGVLTGLFLAGSILQVGAGSGRPLTGFAIIFFSAALFRLGSARLLHAQTDIPLPRWGERIVTGWPLMRKFLRGRDGRFILFLGFMSVAVSIASPFFTPFMLVKLKLTYAGYMVLIGASFGAKILALHYLGRLAESWGAARVFRIAALGIAVLPALWIVSPRFEYLMGVQVLAGTLWAAYEFSGFLLFFDRIRFRERTSLLTAYNLINSGALVVGSLLGGLLLARGEADADSYHMIFLISSGARLLLVAISFALTLTARRIARFSFRTVALRPSWGALSRPLQPVLRQRAPNGDESAE